MGSAGKVFFLKGGGTRSHSSGSQQVPEGHLKRGPQRKSWSLFIYPQGECPVLPLSHQFIFITTSQLSLRQDVLWVICALKQASSL